MFTWVGYEKLDQRNAFMSAMVPRRIPITSVEKASEDAEEGDLRLQRFQLGHYAMLLNIFPFDAKKQVM